MVSPGLLTSNKQDWSTPQSMIDWLIQNGIIQPLTFDLAASRSNTKAAKFFTVEDDALKQKWPPGVLWLNPPFDRELPRFLEKALEELWDGRTEETIIWVFIPCRTDTRWFHELVWPNAEEIFFLKGRVNFLEHGKSKKANAPFPNMLFSFRGPFSNYRWHQQNPMCRTLEPSLEARGR